MKLHILILALCVACASAETPGHLASRPAAPASANCGAGVHSLNITAERDALLYVPPNAMGGRLLVFLHGATGKGENVIRRVQPFADKYGVIVLAPSSRATTWDALDSRLGPDVALIDKALSATFDRCSIDRGHIAVGGFSDGASYALTLGLANGDLFSKVIAFSPCIIDRDIEPKGHPEFFISHGRNDSILPFERCGQPIARRLRSDYRVRFEPFDGDHEIPPHIADAAFAWLVR